MAKRSKPLSSSELKAFRSKIAQLKKQGLISKTDARSAQPYWVRKGPTGATKRLDTWVKEWDDVLSKKAAAVKVPDKQLREYRKSGYETKQGRVIIPHKATEKVKVTKSGTIKVKESKISRTEIPVKFHNLEEWIQNKKLEALSQRNKGHEFWAYKFYGHNSYATFDSLDSLFDLLVEGTGSGLNISDKFRESTRKQQNELYQNLTLFNIPTRGSWVRRDIGARPKTSAAARKRYRIRIRGTMYEERALARDAEAHRNWRARMSKAEKKKYNKKGAARAKKSEKRKRRKK